MKDKVLFILPGQKCSPNSQHGYTTNTTVNSHCMAVEGYPAYNPNYCATTWYILENIDLQNQMAIQRKNILKYLKNQITFKIFTLPIYIW